MNADVRAQFEAWARSEFLSVHRHGDSGPYSHPRTFSAWEAWRAALAARQPVASNQPAGNSGQLGVDGQAVGQEPVCTECGTPVLFECTGCSRSNYPPYMQGPIGEIVYSGEGGLQIEFYDGKPLAPMKLYAAPPAQAVDLGTGVKAIADERERQLQAEGFSREGDQQYQRGELARAATAYVQLAAMDLRDGGRDHIAWHGPAAAWPWAPEWWKPVDARRDLVRAGALIAAQIDLIDSKAVGNG